MLLLDPYSTSPTRDVKAVTAANMTVVEDLFDDATSTVRQKLNKPKAPLTQCMDL